jgi:hypothetical protein
MQRTSVARSAAVAQDRTSRGRLQAGVSPLSIVLVGAGMTVDLRECLLVARFRPRNHAVSVPQVQSAACRYQV